MATASFSTLMKTELPLDSRHQGKVRDNYRATLADGADALVIVASDRISAFDVVMPNGIPGKGVVLTQISRFWFDLIEKSLGDRVSHHLISTDPNDIPGLTDEQRMALVGRVMIGRRVNIVPIECVVRGYLAGSGWKEYQASGTVCGVPLPTGLRQCERLPEPIFTPATKAESGHDENIDFERACAIAGESTMRTLRDLSLAVYQMGHDHAADRGIILADTKFEFGLLADGTVLLADEVMTPDSSRFWPADRYEVGRDQDSYDKQFVRNHLQSLCDRGEWDKTPPAPTLPVDVTQGTMARYLEAFEALTGSTLDAWLKQSK